jgi:hypothetical protein
VAVGIALAAAMALTGVFAWQRRRWAALLLVVEALVWLWLDSGYEGTVLVDLGHHHGLVTADLVAVGAIGLAGLCWARAARC